MGLASRKTHRRVLTPPPPGLGTLRKHLLRHPAEPTLHSPEKGLHGGNQVLH